MTALIVPVCAKDPFLSSYFLIILCVTGLREQNHSTASIPFLMQSPMKLLPLRKPGVLLPPSPAVGAQSQGMGAAVHFLYWLHLL